MMGYFDEIAESKSSFFQQNTLYGETHNSVLTPSDKGKTNGLGSAILWNSENWGLIDRFIAKNFAFGDREYVWRMFIKYPMMTARIVKDSLQPNDSKISMVKAEFQKGKSKIIAIVGARNSGKTALAWLLGEWAREMGMEVYIVGLPQIIPSWAHHSFNIADTPEGSFCIMDETAIQLSSARYKSNKETTMLLPVLRHQNKTIVLCTQNTALTDLNAIRLVDCVFYKMMSQFQDATERAFVVDTITKLMMPKSQDRTLFRGGADGGVLTNFKTPLPECWSDIMSKPFKKFETIEDAIDYAVILRNGGMSYPQITRIMITKGVKRSRTYWEQEIRPRLKDAS